MLLINHSYHKVNIKKKLITKKEKKFFFKKNLINKISSKSKIINKIKIKKKLIEKVFKEVLVIFWNPLSIWKIDFFFFCIKKINKIKKEKIVQTIIKKKKRLNLSFENIFLSLSSCFLN